MISVKSKMHIAYCVKLCLQKNLPFRNEILRARLLLPLYPRSSFLSFAKPRRIGARKVGLNNRTAASVMIEASHSQRRSLAFEVVYGGILVLTAEIGGWIQPDNAFQSRVSWIHPSKSFQDGQSDSEVSSLTNWPVLRHQGRAADFPQRLHWGTIDLGGKWERNIKSAKSTIDSLHLSRSSIQTTSTSVSDTWLLWLVWSQEVPCLTENVAY